MTEKMDKQSRAVLRWDFPLPRTHTGVLLGNAVQGLMVWGEGRQLNVTIGRAGFWDHRYGNAFASRTTYAQVRQWLEAGDHASLRQAFQPPDRPDHEHARPHQLGGGRLEITLPAGSSLLRGDLDTRHATLQVCVSAASGDVEIITVRQAMDAELAWVELPEAWAGDVSMTLRPSWEWVGKSMSRLGMSPPETIPADGAGKCDAFEGFMQRMPEDDPLAIAAARQGGRITIGSALGSSADKEAATLALASDVDEAAARADRWWQAYWRDVPVVQLPDEELQHAYDYGVYKLAGLTNPLGIACTLQGPWLEEYQVPPWSCDYHFNINIEMIYWPCLHANRLEHLGPLWRLIKGWWDDLKQNAERFFEAEDALMLPHAVDDRCQVVGTFWTGTIDHACTAWMAYLAFLQYRFGGDENVLRDVAWPMLIGSFNGYYAMLEEIDDGKGGKQWSLPVSVSPEFKGASPDAWGRDASFQLAALHRTIACLCEAAEALGEEADPRWRDVADRLPSYTTVEGPHTRESDGPMRERIALWEGMDLIDSHRHHSHLGSIYPFCTVDPADEAHREVVAASLFHWVRMGPGGWSGWCVPWAAILQARANNADGAVGWLRIWKEQFTNIGHGTLHDADYRGVTTLSAGPGRRGSKPGITDPNQSEVMQMDAGMGALTAIFELLVQQRGEVLHVLPSVPTRWRGLSFDDVLVEGGFLVSARVEQGRVAEVTIQSQREGELVVHPHLGDRFAVDGQPCEGPVLRRAMKAGEQVVLTPVMG